MASQEFDRTGLGASARGTSPGSHREETDGSAYRLLDGSQDVQRGVLQALGATQILNGILILALGVFLSCLQHLSHHFRHFFFFTFYTGYPLWGAVFFICSGSLTVAAGRKATRVLMQNSFGMNIASATIAFVGTTFLSIQLALNSQALKGCQSSQSPDLCIYLGSSSDGLVSLMLILTLLELAMTISISVMWCLGNVCALREVAAIHSIQRVFIQSEQHPLAFCGVAEATRSQNQVFSEGNATQNEQARPETPWAVSSPPNSAESGIAPDGSDSENPNTQP